jgi:predicted nucleic-acid-binding protein
MKKYILDTNALISFVTDRNLAQQEAVAPLFDAAYRSKCTLVCHQSVLSEFVFVMDKVYQMPKESINGIVSDFIRMPGVELRHETDYNTVLSLWPEKLADFGDSMVASAGLAIKGSVIVTFDTKFRSALRLLGQAVYQA